MRTLDFSEYTDIARKYPTIKESNMSDLSIKESYQVREAKREFLKHVHQSRIALADLIRLVSLLRAVDSQEAARMTTLKAMLDRILEITDNIALD